MNEKYCFVDLYEALQISPTADPVTIHRVYRLLALRYHPDNKETGNAQEFELVMRAFRTLSDPEKRAAYDVHYHQHQKLRWRIFDQNGSLNSREIERQQRRGILSLLYAKRLQHVQKPGLSVREMERLLACAREHLEFSLWYLREKGLIQSGDSGLYWITADGVDACNEQTELAPLREDRLLPSARPERNGAGGQAGQQRGHASSEFSSWTVRPPERTAPAKMSAEQRDANSQDAALEPKFRLGRKIVLK